ncbi:hypothetical protein D3C81_1526990 [compost metagenome]
MKPYSRIHHFFENFLWRCCRNFFNLRAAFLRSHKHDTAGCTVNNHTDVIFLTDVTALLDQQTLHFFAFWSSLVCYQNLAEDFICIVTNFIQILRYFDATGFTAATCMYLSLHHDHWAAQCFGCFHGFIHRKCHPSLRNGHSILL